MRDPGGGLGSSTATRSGESGKRRSRDPARRLLPSRRPGVTDAAWLAATLAAARPQALAALLRRFRDLDTAEEAFQEACLRALKTWPVNGPPRDPAAWLILVGRNLALDDLRRRRKSQPLPPEEVLSDLDDAEADLAERLDGAHYSDDV